MKEFLPIPFLAFVALGFFLSTFAWSQTEPATNSPRLLIRCDDFGMCHAVNMAIQQVIEAKIPISTSVMFACPWYQEAVEILRQHPEVSVGVHLTLNAEWKNYRYKLGIAQYFDEAYSSATYNAALASKTDSLVAHMNNLDPVRVNLQVVHVGLDTPEMSALIDLNTFGLADMSKNREAELQALLSPAFRAAVQEHNLKLITYRDLIATAGLTKMQRPQKFQ